MKRGAALMLLLAGFVALSAARSEPPKPERGDMLRDCRGSHGCSPAD